MSATLTSIFHYFDPISYDLKIFKIYVIFDKKFSKLPMYIQYKNVSEKAVVDYATYNIEGNFSLNFLSLMKLKIYKYNFQTKVTFCVVGSVALHCFFYCTFYTLYA